MLILGQNTESIYNISGKSTWVIAPQSTLRNSSKMLLIIATPKRYLSNTYMALSDKVNLKFNIT